MVFALSALFAVGEASAMTYTVTNLGTLSGSYSGAYSINDAGQVVGQSNVAANTVVHAFLYQNGAMTDLGTLGGSNSIASVINSVGQVVGASYVAGTSFNHAFLYQNGVMSDLGTLGGSWSVARDINSAGQVVGNSSVAGNATSHAFLYQNGAMTDLGTLGGSNSIASGINSAGQVVGQSDVAGNTVVHAFLYQNGVMTDLGTLGGNSSYAYRINSAGQVVGSSTVAGNTVVHAFLYQNGVMTDLGTLGGSNSSAYGINSAGQVVGQSDVAGNTVVHAFLHQNGVMTDLGTLGGNASVAYGINTAGQVVGVSGTAILWSPIISTDPKNLGQPDFCPIGDPINQANGNKYQIESDYLGSGLFPLAWQRYYNNDIQVQSAALGAYWRGTYDRSISVQSTTATVYRPDGKSFKFQSSSGAWVGDADVPDRLQQIATGWTYTTADDSVETYDNTGRLLSIANRAGLQQTLTYSDGTTGPNGGYILDASGNPTATTLPAGRLIRVTDANSRALVFGYDASSRIVKMTDPSGGGYLYTYDASNNLASVTYPDTRARTYLYNEQTYTTGTNLPHALTGILDENATRFVTFTYDTAGRAISTQLSGGAEKFALAYTIDANGNPTSTVVTDPLGTARTYNFKTILGVVKNTGLTQPCATCGATGSNITYDANGNVASRTDFNGNVTAYTYDLTRNLETSRTEASGTPQARTITTVWDANFRLPDSISEPGRVTSYVYDSHGNVTQQSVKDTAAGTTRTWTATYTYSTTVPGAMLKRIVDGPRSDVADLTTSTYYDPAATCTGTAVAGCRGQLQSVTNALGQVTTVTGYDANGRVLSLVDPNGVATSFSYDPRGRLTQRTVGANSTAYSYDGVGQLIRVTLADGSQLNYTYDAAHRLTDITDSLLNRVHYTLDGAGNRIKEEVFDANNTLTTTQSRVFDSLNRLAQAIAYVNPTTSHITTYGYDANGNLTTRTDPLNHTTALAYDALNRLSRVTDALTGITAYGYDPLDQVTGITDPRQAATHYTINALGDALQQASPDSGTTTRSFDAAGNLKTVTDARGVTASYTYDALNRPSGVSYPAAGENVSYTWDSAAGCTYGIGRLCQVSDGAGQTSFAYDAQGNLIQQTRLEAGITSITRYGYDTANQPAVVIPPTGETVSLTRNGAGRIAQVVASNGSASTVLAQQLQYDGAGQVITQTLGNGVTQTTHFDLSGQVSAQTANAAVSDADVPTLPEWGVILMGGLLLFSTLQRRPRGRGGMPLPLLALFGLSLLLGGALGAPTAWADASLQYDAAGNVIQRSTALGATTYTYDAMDRLNSEAGPAKTQSFSYDANGNRLSDGMGSYTYPAASNRMSTRLGSPVTHDAAGHLTSDGSGKTYVYNQAGQLSQVKQGATLIATYYYNYLGERSRKVTTAAAPQGAQTVLYHYDQQSHLIAETSGSGAPLRTYVWRDEAPLAQIEYVPSRRILYYELDQTHTPRAATDATGKVVWRWESDAFGSSAANEDPDGDGVKTTVNLRFPGQYYDQESGLHYNMARDYDPRVGRYVQSDPVGLAGGINTYAYANQNPLSYVDPTGEFGLPLALGVAAAFYFGIDQYSSIQQAKWKFDDLRQLQKIKNAQLGACLNYPQGGACGAMQQTEKAINQCARETVPVASEAGYSWLPSPSDKAIDVLKKWAK
ncbi:PKD domain protein [Sulfuriferula multivorans]|uniref:PKD domain protein n=1 Tax=Sulfuriferula multivorans TaxID=1559896 RepID=A0A401JCH9_9PROT|nr:IPTL-CTERM sorting domain-containing protein [Sulfuriferula multivorans]GBL45309.1 PKD domain protein [Sulfuriferula multivorans]